MNRTKIETCDYTWNPVTGCWGPGGTAEKPLWCSYCYARKMSRRLARMGINRNEKTDISFNEFFRPQFHPLRLSEPAKVKKPSKIFVCSMADLFGDWVPFKWIYSILTMVEKTPQHIFQFLTKNPQRLREFNVWPKNAWVGTTVTNQADADERVHLLCRTQAKVRFISFEPLLGEIRMKPEDVWSSNPITKSLIHWAIIGAMTGSGAVKPKLTWVFNLIDQYRVAGVPIFLKNNVPWKGAKKVQEWPD